MARALGLTQEELAEGQQLYYQGSPSISIAGNTEMKETVYQVKFNVYTRIGNQIVTYGKRGPLAIFTGTIADINAELSLTGFEVYQDENETLGFRRIEDE